MPKSKLKIIHFVLFASFINFLFFYYPFFRFVFTNADYTSLNGIILVSSLIVSALVANAFAFYLFLSLFRAFGKFLLAILFIINSLAIYFINTYSIILDESMIGNVLNTKYDESVSFLSVKLFTYLIVMGIIPSVYIVKIELTNPSWKIFFINTSLTTIFLVALIFANARNWLWVDKNAKELIGLSMPWSYVVNTSRFYIHEHKKNEKEILLPDATIKDDQKSIVVLVIGESARSQNFSLYGYKKNTNPILSKIPNLFHFDATSVATYTTAGVKGILEHSSSDELYEILPNYLYRNNIDVIWRTTNWGEPPVHIKEYHEKNALMASCKGEGCNYDEVLLNGLKEQIRASKKNKILVVLHTSTSHGPTYGKKYPPQFTVFKPVCNSVELGKCSHDELVNAYDNTIVYTDYILSKVIEDLKQFNDYHSTMIFISDHGESLGEKNLYMHGLPLSIAPKEQYAIPFIVWLSDGSRRLKQNKMLSQNHVFHSVLNFLNIQSPIYDEKMNIFSK
ncbi:MAG: phosphoethanolamine transferase [Dyadobacter sp. 50-39]|uniref:phosphoethanolamine--lipid A transferase EptA n=1 Tax=Dyadobacter sp. 50-39 TaxID=1895756 RepID=UPI000963FA8A|nr:phosphoethanolamine--lipid A transferase EptA [Dyadobacter sp. 50-39]OJV15227.1 MAG: phosphoethanolamine transferase [Dyadobacter sp. 50-39]